MTGNHSTAMYPLWAKVTTQEKSEFESSELFHFSFHFVCSVVMYASYIATCFIFLRKKLEGVVGTGWSWLRIGTDGGRLWVR